MTTDQTPGGLLRQARERSGIPARRAAARANVSEALWRQTELGYRAVAKGVRVPVNTGPERLQRMAEAVDADVVAVLEAAGYDASNVDPAATDGQARVEQWTPPASASRMTLRQRRVVESVIFALTDDREATGSHDHEIVPVQTGLPTTVTALVDDVAARQDEIRQVVARVLQQMAEERNQTGR